MKISSPLFQVVSRLSVAFGLFMLPSPCGAQIESVLQFEPATVPGGSLPLASWSEGNFRLGNLRVLETMTVPPTNPPVPPPTRRVVAWGGALEPNIIPGFSNIAAIATGQYHSLGLLTDGTVVSLSDYVSPESDVPADLPRVRAIAAGAAHSLALLSNGTVRAWGFDV